MTKRTAPITANDVARLAGVSRSAVSRAFTEGAYISEEMRGRVFRAAEILGYTPNVIARSLTTQRTRLIGVVSAGLDNPFFAEMLELISRALAGRGYAPIVLTPDESETEAAVTKLLSYQVDGLILTASLLSSKMAARCERLGMPVVLMNRSVDDPAIRSVGSDNFGGASAVADLFVRAGYRRNAIMLGLPDTSTGRDRLNGFRDGLARHGMPIHAIARGNYLYEDGATAARELLGRDIRPDAIFCENDVMAAAALDVARNEFGLQVPERLGVAGFDNSLIAKLPRYDITSVDQGLGRMASETVDMILDWTDESRRSRHVTIPSELVARGSTRPPRDDAQ